MLQKYLVPMLITVVSSFLLVYSLDQEYARSSELLVQESMFDKDLEDVKKVEEKLAKFGRQIAQFPQDGVERLSIMIPKEIAPARFILDVSKVAERNGVVVREPLVTAQSNAATDAKGVILYDLKFKTSATYEQFQRFVLDLEKSLQLRDFGGLLFNAKLESATGGSFSANPIYEFEVSVISYSMKI